MGRAAYYFLRFWTLCFLLWWVFVIVGLAALAILTYHPQPRPGP